MKKIDKEFDVIVIGGGPSGMMCAGRAAQLGARVLILEKNASLGNKLMLTGGGRCNITNADFDTDSFLTNFGDAKKYLFSPFSQFSVKDTFDFFESHGLPLVTEARNRVFPKTQKAQDVFDVLIKYMKKGNVTVLTNTRVKSIEYSDEKVTSIITSGRKEFEAKNIVIATGGLAAPETGATGDGMNFLEELGHTVQAPNPNLVPLTTNAKWVHNLSGITWSFMKIRFVQNGKTKIRKTGKILFTHFGISGPLIINSSSEVKKLLKNGPVEAVIDLFPDTDEPALDKRIVKLLDKNLDKKMKNVLPEMIFKNIALEILELPNVKLSDKEAKFITREERKNLVHTLKNLTFEITGTCGMDKAIVADGGIDLKEVNFKNMTSRKYSNLYLLGDILNINRPSGGFSLQLCWTTGFVAGSDIGNKK
ncbi:MAG: NAD(P)/FAD-dependent oxidoreductase [Patescibacteria group bacterium]|nr:NAD(P)/FAD-dependent oxidoreductase [Patescibacteria group bacterium]